VDRLTELLLASGGGDAAALETLVRAAQADVWRFCAGLVGPAAADDAAQDTFVRVWRSAPTFRGESSARTWILTLARRTCADHLTRAQRRPLPVDRLPERPRSDASTIVAVDDLVARLDPDRRAAFVLTQVLGLGYAEAATVCGCPVGTIRSRVARARDDLMAAMAEPTPPPSPGRH
jgi:RNA polymerase sigma-70 factor (ECF subfamily)